MNEFSSTFNQLGYASSLACKKLSPKEKWEGVITSEFPSSECRGDDITDKGSFKHEMSRNKAPTLGVSSLDFEMVLTLSWLLHLTFLFLIELGLVQGQCSN